MPKSVLRPTHNYVASLPESQSTIQKHVMFAKDVFEMPDITDHQDLDYIEMPEHQFEFEMSNGQSLRSNNLNNGEFNEQESHASFLKALKQWRGNKTDTCLNLENVDNPPLNQVQPMQSEWKVKDDMVLQGITIDFMFKFMKRNRNIRNRN